MLINTKTHTPPSTFPTTGNVGNGVSRQVCQVNSTVHATVRRAKASPGEAPPRPSDRFKDQAVVWSRSPHLNPLLTRTRAVRPRKRKKCVHAQQHFSATGRTTSFSQAMSLIKQTFFFFFLPGQHLYNLSGLGALRGFFLPRVSASRWHQRILFEIPHRCLSYCCSDLEANEGHMGRLQRNGRLQASSIASRRRNRPARVKFPHIEIFLENGKELQISLTFSSGTTC